MYRFNLYHTYTSLNGIITFVLAACVCAFAYIKRDSLDTMYMILYIGLALVLVFYTPITLYFKTKRAVLGSEVLSSELTYTLDETGISVKSPVSNEDSKLEYSQIYAIRQSKHNVLVYSTRVNAFVLPLEAIGDKYEAFAAILRERVDDHKLPKQIKNI